MIFNISNIQTTDEPPQYTAATVTGSAVIDQYL